MFLFAFVGNGFCIKIGRIFFVCYCADEIELIFTKGVGKGVDFAVDVVKYKVFAIGNLGTVFVWSAFGYTDKSVVGIEGDDNVVGAHSFAVVGYYFAVVIGLVAHVNACPCAYKARCIVFLFAGRKTKCE